MKSLWKIALLVLALPAALLGQPGVRMSADFLPLEVGNQWVYDVFNEAGQKVGNFDFEVQEYRIVSGRSFYLITRFPFIPEGGLIKLVRYDRQERQYMRMAENDEGPLFLADGFRAEVLQSDDSGLPTKFVLHGDLVDLTFQRGQGIVEARMHFGKEVQIARLTALNTSNRKAAEAASQGAPTMPKPPTPEQKNRTLAESVAQATDDNVAIDVQVSEIPGGTRFVLTVINSTDKLVPLNFKSSQTYDFEVIDASTGQEVWRWSRRMMFSQVVRQEALRPNRNLTFEAVWNHRDNDVNAVSPGKYKVIGSVAIQPPLLSEAVTFEVQ